MQWTFYFIRNIAYDNEDVGYELFMSRPVVTDTAKGIHTVLGSIPSTYFADI